MRRRAGRLGWRVGGLAVSLLATLTAGTSLACPLVPADGQRLDDAELELAWAVEGGRAIATGTHFSIIVRTCTPGAELLRVDASMPAHRHGMNYRPSITPLGEGRWRADGLMFHMSGAWELRMDLRQDGRLHRLRQPITLP